MVRPRMSELAFRLVEKLQPEVRPQLHRAEGQAHVVHPPVDLPDRASVSKTEISNGDFYGIDDGAFRSRREARIDKKIWAYSFSAIPCDRSVCNSSCLLTPPMRTDRATNGQLG